MTSGGTAVNAVNASGDFAHTDERHARARTHTSDIGESKKTVAFKEFRRSWLTPFFGSNQPEPVVVRDAVHPCRVYSVLVHECLEQHNNNADFCQSKLALFQSCLNEFNV